MLAWVEASAEGDKEATQRILDYFRDDIERLSGFLRMPREEAVQTLTLELLELVRTVRTRRAPAAAGCAEEKTAYEAEDAAPKTKSG